MSSYSKLTVHNQYNDIFVMTFMPETNMVFVMRVDCFMVLFNSLTHNPEHKKKAFKNLAGKGQNAGKQHFLLFPQCFLPI